MLRILMRHFIYLRRDIFTLPLCCRAISDAFAAYADAAPARPRRDVAIFR